MINKPTKLQTAKANLLKVIYCKNNNEEISIEKWEKVSDDLNDVKDQQNEISEFLNMRGIDQENFDQEIGKQYTKSGKELK